MSSPQQAAIELPELGGDDPFKALKRPGVDKLVAVIASIPYLLIICTKFAGGPFNLAALVVVVHLLLQTITMFARRAPVRITTDWRFWLLALLATYWTFLASPWMQQGRPLAPAWAIDSLSLLSLAVVVYARLSLGRNIGFVPAQRRLVSDGAYAWVRHPIYLGIFIAYAAVVLSTWSPLNLLLVVTGCALFMVKSLAEEQFLSGDPEYRDYMHKVRRRWIPGIL